MISILVALTAMIGFSPVPDSTAAVTLSSMLTNHLVLQRNRADPVWGWAQPGQKITVRFAGHTAAATADAQGAWITRLPPIKASDVARNLTISAGTQRIVLHDVLVGKVWLCTGQSNMQYPMSGWLHRTNLDKALAAARHKTIRLYHVPMIESMFAGRPHLTAPARWQVCTPHHAAGFSAVGYFFGNALRKNLHVPIGLIEADWGGNNIEPWISAPGFFKYSNLKKEKDWLKPAMAREKALHHQAAPSNRTGLVNTPNAYHYNFQSTSWSPDPRQNPTTLFNGMINPLIPYGIRGVIWYQGENNVLSHDTHYYAKLQALIHGWRHLWQEGNLPFYIVQIAPFNYSSKWCGPNDTDVPFEPLIWRAEEKAARRIPNCGIASTMDIGDIYNIHPPDKREVGYRLALLAMAKTYGFRNVVYSGPQFKSADFSGKQVVIHFRHVAGGLASRSGKPLSWFQIAGTNGKFVLAQAGIKGDSVVVQAPGVMNPTAVQFAWCDIAVPDLMNMAGLPALPFQAVRRSSARLLPFLRVHAARLR